MEDMLSNWSKARDTVLAVKTKMVELDAQLTSMDNTFAWNCMADKAGQVGHMDDGSGSATGGRSSDASSVSTP